MLFPVKQLHPVGTANWGVFQLASFSGCRLEWQIERTISLEIFRNEQMTSEGTPLFLSLPAGIGMALSTSTTFSFPNEEGRNCYEKTNQRELDKDRKRTGNKKEIIFNRIFKRTLAPSTSCKACANLLNNQIVAPPPTGKKLFHLRRINSRIANRKMC